MQVINPNMNIGFKQIQTNKKLNKKEPLVINNSPLVRSGLASSCILGFSSMLFLDVSLSDLKKDILKNKMLYFLLGIGMLLTGYSGFKTRSISDFYGKTDEKKVKNYLLTNQAISTGLLGVLFSCGVSQAINKKPDRKSGIIAACLAGIALVTSTISNIATWKNYKKENQNKDS